MRTKKKITQFLFVIILMLGVNLYAQVATPPAVGDGSESNPYQIATLDNLYWITQNSSEWDKYYIQTADINASSTSSWDGGAGLTPIGTVNTHFTGSYNGQNYKIENLTINRNQSNLGLFGYIGTGAVLDGIAVVNVNIISSANQIGALVGYQRYAAVIKNCHSTGLVIGHSCVGGLVGKMYGDSTKVEYCWSSSDVKLDGFGGGGLVGRSLAPAAEVRYSYSTGSVESTGNDYGFGGLVGYMYGSVSNCYSSASVKGKIIGGLVGLPIPSATIDMCYSTGLVDGTYHEGGLVGDSCIVTNSYWDTQTSGKTTSYGGTGKTTSEMQAQSTFVNWNFSNVWSMLGYPVLIGTEGAIASEAPTNGDGSAGNPYEITSMNNLFWLSQTSSVWNKHFIQTANINASETSNLNGGEGFNPIGNFSGVYNGNGYTIDDIFINRPNNVNVGVFAYVSGTIKNLGVNNVDITGHARVGGLVGRLNGTSSLIDNCFSTGKVTGTDYEVGGLVGINRHGGIVKYSWSSADVELSGHRGGGLVGYLKQPDGRGAIENCYSSGSVTANGTSSKSFFGGLVGNNEGSITNCYSSASVTLNSSVFDFAGGLAGYSSGTISTSYSTGEIVTEASHKGGLIASGTASDSYWDTETSGLSTSASGTGKTTVEMYTQSTFSGWDFTNTWAMSGYPILAGNTVLIAYAGYDRTIPDANNDGSESVSLDGSSSSVSAGNITSYVWSENGSQIAVGATPTLNLSVGSHIITLTIVADDNGATATDEVVININSVVEVLKAFPTAEGCGALTLGGRGGSVIEVTNLNSDGTGSFRDACMSTGARTIVFRVGGTIDLGGNNIVLGNNQSYLTIAGQTAPGGGIQIKNGSLVALGANHIIIRYIRFRLGPVEGEDDALGANQTENIIFDHVSAYWGIDETLSITNHSKNVTIQWSIIAEGLNESWYTGTESWAPWYDDGTTQYWAHSRGTMVTARSENTSLHHNLIYNHYKRIPLIQNSKAEVINNVIINKYAKETIVSNKTNFDTEVNWIGNYYRFYSHAHKPVRVYNYESNNSGAYYKDNYDSYYRPNDTDPETFIRELETATHNIDDQATPYVFNNNPVTTELVHDAYTSVLDKAGATLPSRDADDIRVVADVTAGNAPSSLVNAHTLGDLTWPTIASGSAPVDSDHDGMPNSWETDNGLNPNDASDRNGTNLSSVGYSNLEVYLNSIVENGGLSKNLIYAANSDNAGPSEFALVGNYPNPFNPSTVIKYAIPEKSKVKIGIYNILGQRVGILMNSEKQAGVYETTWNATNLPSGIYLIHMSAEGLKSNKNFVKIKKALLLK